MVFTTPEPSAPRLAFPGIFCQFTCMMRVIGVLFHRRGELLHAGRRLFNRRRLLLSTGREIGVTRGDLAGSPVDLLRPCRTVPTVVTSACCIVCRSRVRRPISLRPVGSSGMVKSPFAIFSIRVAARWSGFITVRRSTTKGDHRQRQRRAKRAEHKHQPQPGAGVSLRRQRVGAFGAFLSPQQHRVIGIVQRTRGLIFVVNNGFKHAVLAYFSIGCIPAM